MDQKISRIIDNQDGFVLGAAILLSAVLILAGVLSLWTSTTEVQVVRNEGLMAREFYNAEGAAIDALENYNSGPTNWLTDNFMMEEPIEANNTVVSNDSEGQQVATVEARCITLTAIDPDSGPDYELPLQAHIAPPPEGSGYSLKHFEVRRYGITASSADGNSQVQVGAWKAFNKY
ncbi:hypothetical protein JY97_00145 [Alkalispirochaeta odontotermitis]|nr:hypothetical protein JY97_00145 [Alkalispirochaeta odontotermitis]CAB1081988.1 hypothetical protein D1AOALGA4SA_9628 [Olavius algarvensis Delta 1 endosymbiont]